MTTATALKLNFACGGSRWEGFDNSDTNGEPGVTPVDLKWFPYPYESESAELIIMSHALFMTQHGQMLHPYPGEIFKEFHRILQAGGWLRIDDNPCRCYPENMEGVDHAQIAAESTRGYPNELRLPRKRFLELLAEAGFTQVLEVPTTETRIPCDPVTREAILGNHWGHYSFTVECQK